jgi:hypothetical protein
MDLVVYDVSVWTGFISLWVGTPGYSCGNDNKIMGSVNGEEIFTSRGTINLLSTLLHSLSWCDDTVELYDPVRVQQLPGTVHYYSNILTAYWNSSS